MRSSRPTHEATNCGRPVLLRSSFAATFGRSVAPGVPNKPVLPTAPALPNVDPLDSLRRQTGQSLGNEATVQRDTGVSDGKAKVGPRSDDAR